jgi:regulatory protein
MSAMTDPVSEARKAALRLLDQRAYTVGKLRDALLRRHEPDPVDQVLADLVQRGYLDDEAYAADFVRLYAHDRGARRLTVDLRRRKIDPDVIRRAIAGAERPDEPDAATELLRRQLHRYRGFERHVAQRRALGMLARRGFDLDAARRAIDELLGGLDTDGELK